MSTYIISYDLHRPGQNYPELHEAIKKLSTTWWHHLESTWIIVSPHSATDIRNALRPKIDDGDELLVAQSGKVGAWAGFNQAGSEWLKTNL